MHPILPVVTSPTEYRPYFLQANWRHTSLARLRASREHHHHVTLGDGGNGEPPPGAPLPIRPTPDDHAIASAAYPIRPVAGLHSAFLYRRWLRSHMDVSSFIPPHTSTHPAGGSSGFKSVERIDVRGMRPGEFFNRFDEPCKPAVLQGAMDTWPGEDADELFGLMGAGWSDDTTQKPATLYRYILPSLEL